jgi:NAD(P)-dependent dehydrogenase (short-subunit alcohol dehydrogenase family)
MAYSASKAALEGAMKVAAGELAPRNIRVNCLVPGHVQNTGMWTQMSTETPQHIEHLGDRYPLGLGLPSDIANAALFLLSDGARWITGTSVLVDGGYSLRS